MKKSTGPTRAILYLRLSVSKDESVSIANQNKQLQELAARENWTIVETFKDDGISGGKPRANADKALRMLRENQADVIAVYKFDRWSRMGARAVADLQDVLDERAKDGSPALFVTSADGLRSDTETWDVQVALMAALGRTERQMIRSRVKASRDYQRSTRRHSGVPPYGYETVPHPSGKGRALSPHPAEAEVVRRMVDEILSGATSYGVAKGLNADGIKPRRAARWTASTVADILRRDSLLGYMTHRNPKEKNSRASRPLLGDDGLPEQVWPAIITLDEAARLRALLSRHPDWNKMPGAGGKRASRLLSGLVQCSTCHGGMRVNYTNKRKSGERAARYVCSAPSAACARKVSINAEMLEGRISGEFLDLFGGFAVYEIRESSSRDTGELAQVQQFIASTAAEMAAPGADIPTLAATLTGLHARREALEAEPVETTAHTVATGETFAEAWDARDTAGRRNLLSAALAGRIIVRPAVRGSRTLDDSRLDIPWRWNEPDYLEEDYDA